eukprot:11991093-Ditylum_brightwellii.AAC.1
MPNFGAVQSIVPLRLTILYFTQQQMNNHIILGYFMGYTQTRSFIRWYDPTTKEIKLTADAIFDEF